jgi:hypothetical protein
VDSAIKVEWKKAGRFAKAVWQCLQQNRKALQEIFWELEHFYHANGLFLQAYDLTTRIEQTILQDASVVSLGRAERIHDMMSIVKQWRQKLRWRCDRNAIGTAKPEHGGSAQGSALYTMMEKQAETSLNQAERLWAKFTSEVIG